MTIVHVSSSISIVTLALHLAPKLTDMGFSLSGAAVIPIVYTLVALPSQFLAGYVADRFPKPLVTFVFLVFQASGIMVIAFAETATLAYIFAVLYGIGFGGRIPLLTAIRARLFRAEGVRHDNGAVPSAEQYIDDIRAAVRGVHVRSSRVVLRSVLHLRYHGLHGGGADVDGEEAGTQAKRPTVQTAESGRV